MKTRQSIIHWMNQTQLSVEINVIRSIDYFFQQNVALINLYLIMLYRFE